MKNFFVLGGLGLVVACLTSPASWAADAGGGKIRVEAGHPWRPPFGLDRVGKAPEGVVELATRPVNRNLALVAYAEGREIGRYPVAFSDKSPQAARIALEAWPAELALVASAENGPPIELVRQPVAPPAFEAEAIARPDEIMNPVDLGTILVPHGWLLLAGSQSAGVDVAALNRGKDQPGAKVAAWYASAPQQKVAAAIELLPARRTTVHLSTPPAPAVDHDQLHVAIVNQRGEHVWQKTIPTMVVRQPPRWPAFGATRTRLRYDAPISIRAADGTLSSMKYEGAWAPHLDDVVVSFPNGARFVFWRGASYAPFWAGRYNTGLCYEWAELTPPPGYAGFIDCVEPLMDKELRYGRVQILESTPARVHVRWTYQSCDFLYKVWGESAQEDFYFYPDGFGTRVVTVNGVSGTNYELAEFILLSPAEAYPFDILPRKVIDVLFLDGQKREFSFPAASGENHDRHPVPAIYRVRLNRREALAAVSFSPQLTELPAAFAPFSEQGQLVTPCYWGSHWPLARGKTTGWSIDERIHYSPAHNSLMTWGQNRPTPLQVATREALDTLGRPKTMLTQQWAWLIGMSDADDGRLLARARSFSRPPAIELQGAKFDFEAYAPERRAIRLVVDWPAVAIALRPEKPCVDPVFELIGAPKKLRAVTLAGRALEANRYAWDGQTLWLGATVDQPSTLRLEFDDSSPR